MEGGRWYYHKLIGIAWSAFASSGNRGGGRSIIVSNRERERGDQGGYIPLHKCTIRCNMRIVPAWENVSEGGNCSPEEDIKRFPYLGDQVPDNFG